MYIYIYLYIYKKLSPKWKKFQEQQVFLFRFYILCKISCKMFTRDKLGVNDLSVLLSRLRI